MRYCTEPGCPALVERGLCARHGGGTEKPYRWDTNRRDQAKRLITGRALQAARAALYVRAMCACQGCGQSFQSLKEMIRDHIVPLFEDGPDVESNTQALCRRCSDAKTHGESMRGRGLR